MEWRRGEYTASDDRWKVDRDVVHGFLTESYWARGISRDVVERSIRHSLCFGIYRDGLQVGFARVITDHSTFAYLADVFVVPAHRGRGLARWLLECIVSHRELQGLRRFLLATRDAHGLYARFGFAPPRRPSIWMEIHDEHVYQPPGRGERAATAMIADVPPHLDRRAPTPQAVAPGGGCGGERGATAMIADVPPHLNTTEIHE